MFVSGFTHAINSEWIRLYFGIWYILCVFVALNTALSFMLDAYLAEIKRKRQILAGVAIAPDSVASDATASPLEEAKSEEMWRRRGRTSGVFN